jgi:HK97 family phage major capsid protein
VTDMETAILDELKRKRAEAGDRWKEFEEARNEAVKKASSSGEKDLDGDTVDALEALNLKYREVDVEVQKLQDRFEKVALWDSKGPQTSPADEIAHPDPRKGRNYDTKSLGERFVESPEYEAWKKQHPRQFNIEMKVGSDITTTTAGDPIQPDFRPTVLELLFERLTVRDLVAPGSTTSNLVTYPTETDFNNFADTVTEAAAKQQSDVIYSTEQEPVQKIAHYMKVTTEMLEDWAQIRSRIDSRIRLGVKQTEEVQLLSGSGTPPDLSGILDRAVQTYGLTSESNGDAIHKGITKIMKKFMQPTAMVISPTTWEILALEKDQNDQYFGGGPFTGAYGTNGNGVVGPGRYWGLPVVVTSAISDGTALVGAYRTEAQIFDRTGLTVTATNTNEDDFIHNLVTVLGEERLAFAVYRPDGFCNVNHLAA